MVVQKDVKPPVAFIMRLAAKDVQPVTAESYAISLTQAQEDVLPPPVSEESLAPLRRMAVGACIQFMEVACPSDAGGAIFWVDARRVGFLAAQRIIHAAYELSAKGANASIVRDAICWGASMFCDRLSEEEVMELERLPGSASAGCADLEAGNAAPTSTRPAQRAPK